MVIWKIRGHSRWGSTILIIPLIRWAVPFVLFIIMLIFGFQLGSRVPFNVLLVPAVRAVAQTDIFKISQLMGLNNAEIRGIFTEVLPIASHSENYIEDETAGFLVNVMENVTSVNLLDPRSYFLSQVALLGTAKPVSAEPEFVPDEEEMLSFPLPSENEPKEKKVAAGKEPLIAIYCTHNAESYVPSQGMERLEGKNGGVFTVAEHLKTTLEQKYGINTILNSTIHDYPDWSKSYANSLATLEAIKKKYPSVRIFIDVHRDAQVPRDSTIVEINDQKIARIMVIVGSDARLTHPNWRINLSFAKKVGEILDRDYPGLVKAVRVQDGRYNQHVSPQAILVEVGATNNTIEEAQRAVEMLADGLSKVID